MDGSDLSKERIPDVIESRVKDESTCYYLKDVARRHEQFIVEKANAYPVDKLLAILFYADHYDFKRNSQYDTPDSVCDLVCFIGYW